MRRPITIGAVASRRRCQSCVGVCPADWRVWAFAPRRAGRSARVGWSLSKGPEGSTKPSPVLPPGSRTCGASSIRGGRRRH
jgi:hypothetical protein